MQTQTRTHPDAHAVPPPTPAGAAWRRPRSQFGGHEVDVRSDQREEREAPLELSHVLDQRRLQGGREGGVNKEPVSTVISPGNLVLTHLWEGGGRGQVDIILSRELSHHWTWSTHTQHCQQHTHTHTCMLPSWLPTCATLTGVHLSGQDVHGHLVPLQGADRQPFLPETRS